MENLIIQLKFFASARELVKCSEAALNIDKHSLSSNDLLETILKAYPQ